MPSTRVLKDRVLNAMRGTTFASYTPHGSFSTDVPIWEAATPSATEIVYTPFARVPLVMAVPTTQGLTTRRTQTSALTQFAEMTAGAGGFVGYGLEFDALTVGSLLRANKLPNVGGTLTVSAMTGSGVLIQVTFSTPHGLQSGAFLNLIGVLGNTAANGDWKITIVSPTVLSLNGSTGNAAYTSGGTGQPFGFNIVNGIRPEIPAGLFYADVAD